MPDLSPSLKEFKINNKKVKELYITQKGVKKKVFPLNKKVRFVYRNTTYHSDVSSWVGAPQDKEVSVEYGGKIYPNNITNYFEEPQNINLTLADDGMLTLHAGSVVYVPDGVGVFNKRTLLNDLTHSTPYNGRRVIFIRGNMLHSTHYNSIYSGDTPPALETNNYWYDTTENFFKRYILGNWESGYSFPIAIVTVAGGKITSIDQVFQGIGYIGKTIFALPGIKKSFPVGLNADGTCKNEISTTTSVLTLTVTGWQNRRYNYLQIGRYNQLLRIVGTHYFADYPPPIDPTIGEFWFNPRDNYYYYHPAGSGVEWARDAYAMTIGYIIVEGGQITQFDLDGLEVRRKLNFRRQVSSLLVNEKGIISPLNNKTYKCAVLDWYTDSLCTQLFDFNTPITNNITLYAKWSCVEGDEGSISNPGGVNASTTQTMAGAIPSVIESFGALVIGAGGSTGGSSDVGVSSASEGIETQVCIPGVTGQTSLKIFRSNVKGANLNASLGAGAVDAAGGNSTLSYSGNLLATALGGAKGNTVSDSGRRMNLADTDGEKKLTGSSDNIAKYLYGNINKETLIVEGYSSRESADGRAYNRFVYKNVSQKSSTEYNVSVIAYGSRMSGKLVNLCTLNRPETSETLAGYAGVTKTTRPTIGTTVYQGTRNIQGNKQFLFGTDKHGFPGAGIAFSNSKGATNMAATPGKAGGLFIQALPPLFRGYGYRQLNYIHGQGTYFKTGVALNNIKGLYIQGCAASQNAGSSGALVGAVNSSGYRIGIKVSAEAEAPLYGLFGRGNNSGYDYNGYSYDVMAPFVLAELRNGSAKTYGYVDNQYRKGLTVPTTPLSDTLEMYIFGENNNGSASGMISSNISLVSFYLSDGTFVSFIPVQQISTGKIGFLKTIGFNFEPSEFLLPIGGTVSSGGFV